jgi:hypothetical protein
MVALPGHRLIAFTYRIRLIAAPQTIPGEQAAANQPETLYGLINITGAGGLEITINTKPTATATGLVTKNRPEYEILQHDISALT